MTATTTTTTTNPDRAEINRRNAQKSTGPRSAEGKGRSRFNALKHGMAAKTLVLPGEDPEVFQERIEAWTADLQPANDLEQYLVEHAAAVSWQLDRADRADTARLASIIRTAPAEEALRQEGEVAVLGRRLFLDSHGALRSAVLEGREARVENSGGPDAPDHPAAIVHQLEATAGGCHWLLDRWTELGAKLEQDQDWPLHDRLKAFRLLGKPSLDLPGDPDVAAVMSLEAQGQAIDEDIVQYLDDPEDDPESDLTDEELSDLGEPPADEEVLLEDEPPAGEKPTGPTPEEKARERDQLRAIVGRSIARLEALAASHRERAEANDAERAARLSFDASVEGERVRRYQASCNRSLFRTFDALLKLRRAASSQSGKRSAGCGESRPSPVETETLAETSATIVFGADDVLARAVAMEIHCGHQLQETTSLVPDLSSFVHCCDTLGSSLFDESGAEARPEPTDNGQLASDAVSTVELVAPCGPEAHDDRENLPNEPTTTANGDAIQQNEPTITASDHQDQQNEPTITASDHQDQQNEPMTTTPVSDYQDHQNEPTTARQQDAWCSIEWDQETQTQDGLLTTDH